MGFLATLVLYHYLIFTRIHHVQGLHFQLIMIL